MTPERAKPWSRANEARRIRSPNEEWADAIDDKFVHLLHPWQYDAVFDPSRWITLLVGRGGTKTTTMKWRFIRKLARIPGGRLVYCASSRPMAEELMWGPLKSSCEWLGLVTGRDVEFNETKLKCTFLRTGATLRLVGIDDRKEIDKLRGQPFDEVDLDETSIYLPELLENLVHRVIEPRLGDRLGCLVMGGTPGHILRGLFYDATRSGSDQHRPYADRDKPEYAEFVGWSSHAWALADVAALPDAEHLYPALVNLWRDALLKKERNKWGDDHPIWLREYLGKWAADHTDTVFKYRPHVDGKAWNEWDPFDTAPGSPRPEGLLALRAAIAKLPSEHKDWHFVIGADEGYSDPFALNIFGFAPADPSKTIWHVHSFERTRLYAKPIAEMLLGDRLNASKPDGIFGVTGWPDAAVIDADPALIDELGNVYGVRFAKAERKRDYKHGAIELVNGDLIGGQLKILKGSPLATQLGELQWAVDQWGNFAESKSQANHSTDCLIYARKAIAALFETGSVDATSTTTTKAEQKPDEPTFEVPARGEFAEMFGAADETYDHVFNSFGSFGGF